MTQHNPEFGDLARRFERTAALEFAGVSPRYERLALAIAGDADLLGLAAQAPPQRQPSLLLFAAVQYLLLGGVAHPLAAYYPSLASGSPASGDPVPLFKDFCAVHRDALAALLRTRLVQTNEVRRCAGWLPAIGLVSRLAGGLPLALVEVGASAGLNLLFDHYAYDYGAGGRWGALGNDAVLACELRGALRPPLPAAMPPIQSRIGLDLHPIDVRDPDAARWLHACLWPEQRDRASLLDRALAVARRYPVELVRGDALAGLPGMVEAIPREVPVCLYHSATLAYFSREERVAFVALVARLAVGRELYWLSSEGSFPLHRAVAAPAEALRRRMEEARGADVAPPPVGHWLVLTTFAAGRPTERLLAMIASHGSWLEWHDALPA